MITLNQYITTALFTLPDSLVQFKSLIKQKDIELKLQFNPHQSVSGLLKEKSDFIDLILNCCWEYFLGVYAKQLSLCAVGGYGRRELFPQSDIDIIILLDSEDRGLLVVSSKLWYKVKFIFVKNTHAYRHVW